MRRLTGILQELLTLAVVLLVIGVVIWVARMPTPEDIYKEAYTGTLLLPHQKKNITGDPNWPIEIGDNLQMHFAPWYDNETGRYLPANEWKERPADLK